MKRIPKKAAKVKQNLRQKRSLAAIKGWETRRKNETRKVQVSRIRPGRPQKVFSKRAKRNRRDERENPKGKRVSVSGSKSGPANGQRKAASKKKTGKQTKRSTRTRVRQSKQVSQKERKLQAELRRVKAELENQKRAHKRTKKAQKKTVKAVRAAKRALREKLELPKREEVFEIAKKQRREEIIAGTPLVDILRMLSAEERAALENMTVIDVFRDMGPHERQQSIKKYIQETMDRACRLFGDVRITAYEIAEELLEFDIDYQEVYNIWDYDRGRIFGEAA